MPYFPIFTDIKDKTVLIAGGGRMAERKLKSLAAFKPCVVLCAPEISGETEGTIKKLKAQGLEIRLIKRPFEENDLNGVFICIAATDDRQVNAHISGLCAKKGIPVNVVDDPGLCSFNFPALVLRGELTVGISTAGLSPAAAGGTRRLIDGILSDNAGDIVSYLGSIREKVFELTKGREGLRSKMFSGLYELCMEKDRGLSEEEFRTYIENLLKAGV